MKTADDTLSEEARQRRFQRYAALLRRKGVYAGTSHKRVVIPKTHLDDQDLRALGFEQVVAAIPEAGQDRFYSYRHPSNLFHLHSHPGRWTMHEDEYPSATMLAKRYGPWKAFVMGAPHVVTEGVPGFVNYLGGRLAGRKSTADEVEKEMRLSSSSPAVKTAETLPRKTFGGTTFIIDRPKGTVKVWPQPDGGEKRFTYPCDYGYFPRLKGEDGEGLDAFVGDDPSGHYEVFQKLKPRDAGGMELDETKFLVGVSDAEREAIYRLYGDEIHARRVFRDMAHLRDALEKFEPKKKARYVKTAHDNLCPRRTREFARLLKHADAPLRAFARASRKEAALKTVLARYKLSDLKRADIDKLIRGHVVAMPNTGRQTPAEDASIADRLTRVFDRADAKTQPTGEESSIGQTPLEGSVSL